MRTSAKLLGVLAVLSALLLMPWAIAAPVGANTTAGPSERGNFTVVSSVTIGGGNVTQVNVTGNQLTSRWAGFYGTITAGLKLADSTNNIFYEWTITNISNSVVYAANGSVSDFAALTHGNQSTSPSYLADAAADNFNNTFTSNAALTTNTISLSGVNYTTTWQGGSQGTLRTYALADVANAIHVWAGVAEQNVSSFKTAGNFTDYQILVPSDSSQVTYTFYLELP